MITVRPGGERLHTRIGWLDSRHTFSFEGHIDPRHMGFRALRVINEDRIAAGHGFGMQPHRDMEIVVFVVAGALRHADSLGTNAIVRQGDVMRLSAGTGVLHSEFNASDRDALHLMQVWLTPERSRLVPSYQQRAFTPADRQRGLVLVASRDGRNGSITIHQDVAIYSARLGRGEVITLGLAAARHVWVQMLRGSAQLNGVTLKAGDGAAAAIESLELRSLSDSETLLFDLA